MAEILSWSQAEGWGTIREEDMPQSFEAAGGGIQPPLPAIGQMSISDLYPGATWEEESFTPKQAGVSPLLAAIPAIASAIPAVIRAVPAAKVAVPAALAALGITAPAGAVGVAGAVGAAGAGIYGILQALGLGEGEGLFGLDPLGGDTQYVNGLPIGGPGLAEPGKEMLLKEWHVQYDWGRLQYYLVVKPGTKRRYIMMYNTRSKAWKAWPWKAPHLAVIGKNMPRHQMLTRLRRNLSRHTGDAKTLLKITSPGSLAKPRHHRNYRRK